MTETKWWRCTEAGCADCFNKLDDALKHERRTGHAVKEIKQKRPKIIGANISTGHAWALIQAATLCTDW